MSSLNILGLKTGEPENERKTVPPIEAVRTSESSTEHKPEPKPTRTEAKTPTDSSTKPKATEPTNSAERKTQACKIIGPPAMPGSQASLLYGDFDSGPKNALTELFSKLQALVHFGVRIGWISVSRHLGYAFARHSDTRVLANLPLSDMISPSQPGFYLMFAATLQGKGSRLIRFAPDGGFVAIESRGGIHTEGVNVELANKLQKKRKAKETILDVAMDHGNSWVVISNKSVSCKNVDKSLVKMLQETKGLRRIPHLRGKSWLIQSEHSWYSNNIPGSIYKKLSEYPKNELDAFVIAPSGQWAATFYQKVQKGKK